MENTHPEGPSEPIVPREIYITPEQIAIKAIVDAIDARVMKWINGESK